ncbi:Maf family nucleotide pyrophosphatase [Alteromonas sp. C1M14]|uniref:Maf family protein n=1 Tax=Alteromonas sp. C1M14 TaxID=2841567 RepID=UPI001C0A4ECC|nr:Maf family nucleotide pyrophosphatase [Alteromonas sp. C1M14]MBU2976709.1 septum formation protein Maf [Alteromonas sp. C1M14]
MQSYPFILASSSSYRLKQLSTLGIQAKAIAPEINETPLTGESPQHLSERLAQEKAEKIASQYPNHIIIAGDQVASVTDKTGKQILLGKPHTFEAAVSQLSLCSGQHVTFHSALSVMCYAKGKQITSSEVTDVWFNTLTAQHISAYLECEEPYDCAGSFKSEGKGILLFQRISSRDPNALIGVPCLLLRDMLEAFGVDLLLLATRSSE